MTRLCTCADAEQVATRASAEIAQQLQRARTERGVAHLALSGGTTPARTYELLAEALRDWAGIEVWFADERCVGPQDAQSNYRLAAETLLERAAIPAEQVHRMEGELGPEEGARRYADALSARVAVGAADGPSPAREALASERDPLVPMPAGAPDPETIPALPTLDLIVLGIGPDGHVASLFPGAPTLDADPREICLGVHESPKPPPQRITLSLAILRAARRCLLLATGAGKADAITRALAQPTHDVPASLLRRERLTVIVDDAASPAPPGRSTHPDTDCGNLW